MNKKVTLVLSIFTILLFTEVSAQTVYFTGLGRALVTNDRLSDNTNLASKQKSSGGYTLFDLGIYAKPSEVLRASVILRTRSEFGGYFGNGALLSFRQMQLEGLIAKQVKYDIYLTHTRYTLWNDDSTDTRFEANNFSVRRSIVNYENFYAGNAWRMQGINTKARIKFKKGVESLGIRVYGGRTMQTNYTTIPDRYFYGGRLDLVQSKYFRIAGNVAGISDIPGTVQHPNTEYQNMVYTTDFGFTLDNNEKFRYGLSGEIGSSNFQLTNNVDSTTHTYNDYFYDVKAEAAYKPLNLVFSVSYRDVGYNFNSPMAQTRRMSAPSNITLNAIPTMNDGVTARPINLLDMYSQESNMYNQSISTTLMDYYIQYNIVEPYGKATPNRKGFTFNADLKDNNKLINTSVQVSLLSEGVSEGDSLTLAKRNFNLVRAGFVFNLNQLFKFEKLIAINAGIRTESSDRSGANPVHLASTLIDLGLDVEVLKNLHLIGGAKMFNVKGNEVHSGRDQLNQIVSYGPVNFDQNQQIIATGLRYDYDKVAYFSMQYQMVNYRDKLIPTMKYDFNQWFFVFGLKF
jgi:hypothetical protein